MLLIIKLFNNNVRSQSEDVPHPLEIFPCELKQPTATNSRYVQVRLSSHSFKNKTEEKKIPVNRIFLNYFSK